MGRTPHEAWTRYVLPLREALRCITSGRFVLRASPSGLIANKEYSVSLNDMNSVPLRGTNRIRIIAGQTISIEQRRTSHSHQRFRVNPLSYTYGFTLETQERESELLMFHWLQEGASAASISPGHVHIGPALLAHPTAIRPNDFHRAHVPTGQLDFATVVRFAVAELGVTPQVHDWQEVLARSDALSKIQHAQ